MKISNNCMPASFCHNFILIFTPCGDIKYTGTGVWLWTRRYWDWDGEGVNERYPVFTTERWADGKQEAFL
jgi:hypothetical protein